MVTKASPVIKVGRCVPGRHLALWGFPRTLHSLRHGKVEKGDSGSPAIAARKGEGGATNYPSQQGGVEENKKKFQVFVQTTEDAKKMRKDLMIV